MPAKPDGLPDSEGPSRRLRSRSARAGRWAVVMAPISILPWVLGFAGTIYGVAAAMGGAPFVVLALRLRRAGDADRRPAHRLFGFSIMYLFALFAALLVSNGGDRWSTNPDAATAVNTVGSLQVEAAARSGRVLGSIGLNGEV